MAGVADRWLLPVTLLLPLLALGGVTPATLLVAVGCVVTLALTKCWGDEPTPRTRAARVLVSIAWAHAALVGLQLVPLPASVLGAVSPGALSGWTAADTAFGLPTRWHPSTVDPPGTLFALATALTTAAFTDVATRIARNRRGRAALVRAIVIALAVFVAVGLLARLFDRGVAFGLYAPRQPLPSEVLITTTLVNTNHAAAAIAIAPALLFGYAMERSSLGQRILLGVAVVVTATSVVLTLSRGGIVVVAFELAAMAFYASARDRRSRLGPAGFVVGAVAGTVATAALVAGEAVTHEATTGDLSKLEVIRRATHLAAAFPHVGVGRGAFASAFAAHESPASGGLMLFSHAENAPVHLAAELGFIAAGSPTSSARPPVTRCAGRLTPARSSPCSASRCTSSSISRPSTWVSQCSPRRCSP